MRTTRRLVFVLVAGLLVSSSGAIWIHESDRAVAGSDDNPIPVTVSTVVAATTTLAPTTLPPTTTAAPAPAARPARPARVPSNPYANEPIVEIGTIEIPKIGLNHRVFRGLSLRSIDQGPSHWPGTASPGQVGNAVFAGHRVTHSHPFRNIDQLVPGDEVIFTVDGVRSTYAVTGSEVVPPSALHIVDQTPTPTATIFACHPPGSARFRYVVHLSLRT